MSWWLCMSFRSQGCEETPDHMLRARCAMLCPLAWRCTWGLCLESEIDTRQEAQERNCTWDGKRTGRGIPPSLLPTPAHPIPILSTSGLPGRAEGILV